MQQASRIFKPNSRTVFIALLLGLILNTIPVSISAQTYRVGQHVEPAFEGWRPNPDGSFNMMFGYMNENWEEEPNVAVGEHNFFAPGEADRGQPTHFLPRRNRFTFEVTVPSDWGDRELIWSLNVNGIERKAYATLRQDYLVDNMVIASETGSLGAGTSSPESRANVPPVVTVQGDNVRIARVGEPIQISTHVWDDGLPERRRESTNTNGLSATSSSGTIAVCCTAGIAGPMINHARWCGRLLPATIQPMNG